MGHKRAGARQRRRLHRQQVEKNLANWKPPVPVKYEDDGTSICFYGPRPFGSILGEGEDGRFLCFVTKDEKSYFEWRTNAQCRVTQEQWEREQTVPVYGTNEDVPNLKWKSDMAHLMCMFKAITIAS